MRSGRSDRGVRLFHCRNPHRCGRPRTAHDAMRIRTVVSGHSAPTAAELRSCVVARFPRHRSGDRRRFRGPGQTELDIRVPPSTSCTSRFHGVAEEALTDRGQRDLGQRLGVATTLLIASCGDSPQRSIRLNHASALTTTVRSAGGGSTRRRPAAPSRAGNGARPRRRARESPARSDRVCAVAGTFVDGQLAADFRSHAGDRRAPDIRCSRTCSTAASTRGSWQCLSRWAGRSPRGPRRVIQGDLLRVRLRSHEA